MIIKPRGLTDSWRAAVRSVLQPGDRYDLEVRVRLPESAYNRDVARVGVFMVTVEMMSADGRVAYKSTVPGMMRYRSTLVAMASTLLRLPLLVMGVSSEEQTVRLVMLENVVEKESRIQRIWSPATVQAPRWKQKSSRQI